MAYSFRAALALAALSANSIAFAQSSIEQMQERANQLLSRAGGELISQNGKIYDGLSSFSNIRSAGRCVTKFATDYPNNPDLPEGYSGRHDESGDIKWAEDVENPEAQGSRVYYSAVGNISHQTRRFYYVFSSPSDAQEFAEVAKRLADACAGGGQDDGPVDEEVIDPNGKVASLAIDRDNGNQYGWAVDYDTLEAADQRALNECGRGGNSCHIVLRFTGGCGAYAVDAAKGSTIYGWGTAGSRGEAEGRARSEVSRRGGTDIVTRVWGCNSINAAPKAAAANAAANAAAEARAERERQFQEALRKHDEEVKAHDAAMEDYRKQVQETKDAIAAAAERGAAAKADYEAELAKAKAAQDQYSAAQDQYEKERQAYREAYKKATGHYPDGN